MDENQNIGEHIDDLLTGGRQLNEYCEFVSDSDEILEHWRNCEHCQNAVPDAIGPDREFKRAASERCFWDRVVY